MKRNKNRLIGVIHFLSRENKCLLMLSLTIFALIGNLDAQTPKIWPTEISFNYEGGSSNDAITIKKNASSTISAPEYIGSESSVTKNENCAYIKSQSNRKIKVKFNSNNINMNYLVKATVISGAGIGNICEMFVAPCDLNTTEFTIDIQGTIPSSVCKNTFSWKWEATALPTSSPYCPITCTYVSTTHTFYTMLATPQTPMSTPWTDVLEYACVWASGQSTNSNVLYYLCNNLYNNSGLDYDGNQSHYDYISYPFQKFKFNLTDFLSEWNKADCQDMSMFLSILSSSVGAYLNQTRRIQGSFSTKSIDPVGTTYGWGTTSWNFHHIGWLNNIYDPCIRLNSSSPYIPINSNINSPYKTDLYNSGTWSPQNAFILGQTDPYWGLPTEIQ